MRIIEFGCLSDCTEVIDVPSASSNESLAVGEEGGRVLARRVFMLPIAVKR
jgi:hypothetical protein